MVPYYHYLVFPLQASQIILETKTGKAEPLSQQYYDAERICMLSFISW